MGLPQLVHVTNVKVAALSAIMIILGSGSVIVRPTYILYVSSFRNFIIPVLCQYLKGLFFGRKPP
jgi:hypothetical protein